jgi:hypothetical protein
MPISPDILIEALGVSYPASDDGQSVAELVQKTGHDRQWVQERLRALQSQGQLVAGRRRITDIAGRKNWIPVYKIVGEGS